MSIIRDHSVSVRHVVESLSVLANMDIERVMLALDTIANPPQALRVKRLDPAARVPAAATVGAACFDLQALSGGHIAVGEHRKFGTGLAFEVPAGYVMLVFSRSGHGFKNGVRLSNCTGVIDSDYRGELFLRLRNDGDVPFEVQAGDRIAQAMLVRLPAVALVEAAELSDTARGAGGLGSTGTSRPARPMSDREWAALPADKREPR